MTTIIADNEFTDAAQAVVSAAKQLEEIHSRFAASIEQMRGSVVKSETIEPAVGRVVSESTKGLIALEKSVSKLTTDIKRFIEDIDEIDTWLY
jgi:hypothetical protein